MSSGWNKAQMAALRTRLTPQHIDFLEFLAVLERQGMPGTKKNMPPADRSEDRMRQFCRRAGVAAWGGSPGAWYLTDAGRIVLARRIEAQWGETLLSGSTAKQREPDGGAGAP